RRGGGASPPKGPKKAAASLPPAPIPPTPAAIAHAPRIGTHFAPPESPPVLPPSNFLRFLAHRGGALRCLGRGNGGRGYRGTLGLPLNPAAPPTRRLFRAPPQSPWPARSNGGQGRRTWCHPGPPRPSRVCSGGAHPP